LEAIVELERKVEGPSGVVAGRIEELRRFEAAERALAEAYSVYCYVNPGGTRYLGLMQRRRGLATLLAERIGQLGGRHAEFSDDCWISGSPKELATLIEAERVAHRTYHDHLEDFDPDTQRLVRDRILAEHEDTIEALDRDSGRMPESLEYDLS
jgi:hypothetical protein